jgi:beta-carotene hydroxylase
MAEGTSPAAGHQARIAVPRQWIGAPDSAWNPTLTLMVVVLAGFAFFGGGLLAGRLSAWLATPALGVCIYWIFTVLHESMHGIAHRNRKLNAGLGRLAGIPLMLPLPLFRAAHLAHHSHTNNPERDPDLMVAKHPTLFRPIWFIWTPIHYRVMVYGGGMLRDRNARFEAFATDAAIVATIVLAVATGHGLLLLQLWVLPSVLAIMLLALAFDLLPHHPHTTRERYYDTRVYPGRILNALLLGQNYHLVHHLWTTIPWYHYARSFESVKADLQARDAPIGWRRRAERLPAEPAAA